MYPTFVRGRRTTVTIGVVLATVVATALTASASADEPVSAGAAVAGVAAQTILPIEPRGSGNLRSIAERAGAADRSAPPAATADPGNELPPVKRPNAPADNRATPPGAPDPPSTPVTGQAPATLGFESLTTRDSRYANNGNQFTLEPPDQALCVGGGFTMASVNTAIAVYDSTGAQVAPTVAVNEFFGLAPIINREQQPNTFGPFAFDPVCYYDHDVDRWFYLVTELDQDPFTGAFTGGSNIYLAVSANADPLGDYAFFSINTTSGDSTDQGCPCFDDFPHIGADANGFYISANRFSLAEPTFNGAQIYAISKRGLAATAADPGVAPPVVVSINAGPLAGKPSFTVQPMTAPAGTAYPDDHTYFLSTTDFDSVRESTIGLWVLSNTDSLDLVEPQVQLTNTTIPSLEYVFEPDTPQRPGPAPLAESLGEPLNKLDSPSDMSEVKYADGKLWSAIGTGVGPDGEQRAGVLWLQVAPSFADGNLGGQVVNQGYLAVETDSLLYPAVGVNAAGRGAIVLSLAGPGTYPSPAYVAIDQDGVRGPVQVPRAGFAPADGNSCYAEFGSRERGCRWGDYSSAVADENGRIWMATEWIPNSARIPLSNWGTYVLRYQPS